MAIIDEGILGGFRGKIGTEVGVSNGGRYYMRSLPRKKKKITPRELMNQAKFKVVLEHLDPIKDLVKAGFKDWFTRTGGYRAALSYNRKYAVAGEEHDFYIDPALFRMSGGDLPGALDPQAHIADGNIEITWTVAPAIASEHSDQMMILVYDRSNSKALTRVYDGPYRRAGTYSMAISPEMINAEVDVYIGFVAADRSAQSDSQYLGRFLNLG
ncbi:hypothetical protein GZH53_02100 [Flavihumibacter sp. R14]|nr:hypothetical protein [Flavihumibacter soli]